MGLNWYVIANKKFLSPKDLFAFYAFMLSPGEFSDRESLIKIAEQMNYMRDIYIKTLLQKIADELSNITNPNAVALDWAMETGVIKPFMSHEEWYDYYYGHYYYTDESEEGEEEEDEDAYDHEQYMDEDRHDEYMDYVYENFDIRNDIKDEVVKIVDNLRKGNVSDYDLSRAIYYFNNFPWTIYYGGKQWAEIVKWTKKLIHTPPIDIDLLYKGDIKQAIEQMRRLGYVLDVINSIEHNTDMVFGNEELLNANYYGNKWLSRTLETVKYADPLVLAYFSGDPNIMLEVSKSLMLSPQYRPGSSNVIKSILDMLQKMPDSSAQIFLRQLKDKRLILALTKNVSDGGGKLIYLLSNPVLYRLDDNIVINFMKDLISVVGINKFSQEARIAIMNYSHILSPAVYSFLEQLNSDDINEALRLMRHNNNMPYA